MEALRLPLAEGLAGNLFESTLSKADALSKRMPLDDLIGEAKNKMDEAKTKADEVGGMLTNRTRGLIDSIAALAEQNKQIASRRSATAARPTKAPDDAPAPPPADDDDGDLDDDDPAPTFTSRLAALVSPQPPASAADLAALQRGDGSSSAAAGGMPDLDGLQSTLGAAYMLLAAEAKAEALQSELSEARGDLATTLSSGEELLHAHERCVDDYAEVGVLPFSPQTWPARCTCCIRRVTGGRHAALCCCGRVTAAAVGVGRGR